MGRVRDSYFDSLTPEQEREIQERGAEHPEEPDWLTLEPELPFPPQPDAAGCDDIPY